MKTLIFFCLLFFGFVYSQKIQLKKDKIVYNDKEVAVMKNPYRDHYGFYDLSGKKVFDLDLKGVALANQEPLYYLDMKSEDGRTTQIPYEVLITSFKVDRIIAHQLGVKYDFFNEKGLNTDAINKFFNVERENLGDKYLQIKVVSATAEDNNLSSIVNLE